MTDREMHELAAKAAGVDAVEAGGSFWVKDEDGEYFKPWRPREDDGDALRLAAALDIRVCPSANCDVPTAYCSFEGDYKPITEPHGDDKLAAIRLAIFRCAVEIGKSMP